MTMYLNKLAIDDNNVTEAFENWAEQRAADPTFKPCGESTETPWHGEASLFDDLSGDEAGTLTYTFAPRDAAEGKNCAPTVIDKFITLEESATYPLKLVKEFGPREGWNSNFLAKTEALEKNELPGGKFIVIETANRFALGSDIEGRSVKAHLTAYAMRIQKHKIIDNPLSEAMRTLFSTDEEYFAGPVIEDDNFFYTTFEGFVVSFKEMKIAEGGAELDFHVLDLATTFGRIPLVVRDKDFDGKEIEKGDTLIVDACIVAQLLELWDEDNNID